MAETYADYPVHPRSGGWTTTIDIAHGRALTLIVTSNQRRGAEVFGEQLAAELPDRGWTVDFVALTSQPTGPTVSAEPLTRKAPGTLGRLEPGLVARLGRRLRRSGAAVVLANGSATLHYGAAAARLTWPRPRVAYVSIGEPRYWLTGRRQLLTHRLFLSLVDRVLAVSEATATQLGGMTSTGKVEVAQTGIPERLVRPQPLHARPLRPEDELRLLFVGSLSPEKGPDTAVEVAGRLAATRPCRLRLVGSGPLAATLPALAEALGIGDAIELTGSVADVGPHLDWADIVVLPSRTEGLPGDALEAAGAGRPVVAFCVGGMEEALGYGRAGVVVAPGDVAGMVDNLAMLADDQPRRETLGKAGQDLVRSRFTLDAAVGRYDTALRRLVRGGGQR